MLELYFSGQPDALWYPLFGELMVLCGELLLAYLLLRLSRVHYISLGFVGKQVRHAEAHLEQSSGTVLAESLCKDPHQISEGFPTATTISTTATTAATVTSIDEDKECQVVATDDECSRIVEMTNV